MVGMDGGACASKCTANEYVRIIEDDVEMNVMINGDVYVRCTSYVS